MQETIRESQQLLTAVDWIKLCTEWEGSGEKQQQFCEHRKINYTTFVYWRMKCKKRKKTTASKLFSEINLKPIVNQAFKIHLPNGISFTVPASLDKLSLKNLFELLGVLSC